MSHDPSIDAVLWGVLDLVGRRKEQLLAGWSDGFRGNLDDVVNVIRNYPGGFRSPLPEDARGWSIYRLQSSSEQVSKWSVSVRLPAARGGLSDLSIQLEITRDADRLLVEFLDVLVE